MYPRQILADRFTAGDEVCNNADNMVFYMVKWTDLYSIQYKYETQTKKLNIFTRSRF